MRYYLTLPRPALNSPGSIGSVANAMRIYLGITNGQNGEGDIRPLSEMPVPENRSLRLLMSYHYYKDVDMDAILSLFKETKLDVFADSGAYSAMTVGKPINVPEYIAWAKKWEKWFTCIAGPDVVGDPKATADATEKMMAAGFSKPILPTFHMGENWDWLDYWVKKVDYLAFGGMVPYVNHRRLLAAWLVKAFGHIPPHVKVHGFGMTNWRLMMGFPWYSVDSSSWTAGFRYAGLLLFDTKRKKMVKIHMGDKTDTLRHAPVLAQYGLRPTEIQAANYDRDWLCRACIESWWRVEDHISKQIYFVTSERPVAPNSPNTMARVLEGKS